MNSSWPAEIGAIFMKEVRSELRTRNALLSSGLFSLVAVVAIALASYGRQIDATVGAGLLWVTLLFAAIISLPRLFIGEEESGTGDLLRLMARPHAVFWGKTLFNCLQMVVTALVLSLLFLTLVGLTVSGVALYLVSLIGGCLALSFAVTLCGALVANAANRSALAAAVAVPLLLPLIAVGVGAVRASFETGPGGSAALSVIGLYAYAVLMAACGPYLYAAVWKE